MKGNVPSKKKVPIPISEIFEEYLVSHNRSKSLPYHYEDLLRYESAIPLLDTEGNDTLWETVFYAQADWNDVNNAMKRIYALLKTDGDVEVLDHLKVARHPLIISLPRQVARIRCRSQFVIVGSELITQRL